MAMRDYTVYILASHSHVIYIGVTNDIRRRVWQHQRGVVPGFTRQYHVTRLVYLERTADVSAAIAREKQLKRWPRWRKNRLIEHHNAGWADLSAGWYDV
jgi:putative endonuclease